MTLRQVRLDGAQCLRAATAPLVTLFVLALARTAHPGSHSSAGVDELLLVAWRAAAIATLLWVLVAVIWAATRPLRDRRALQRLQHLRELATPPDRALVHVHTTIWSSTAGQHVVVVNVTTGQNYRVWLPETAAPIGAFVVLERTDGGVKVVDWMNAHQVVAAHRHERRHSVTSDPAAVDLLEPGDRDDVLQLIEETEQFLKEQEPRS